jgi:CarD family transcriptional regulator
MMQFSIGDKVMHPKFGAGEIIGEEHRELVNGFRHYFVINVLGTGATAYVPIGKMEELGVRSVMSWGKRVQVLSTLRSLPQILSNDYKQRQARVQEKLSTFQPIPVAEAVRDLTWHRKRKRLTQKDEALLKQGRELLTTEIALAANAESSDVQEMIDAALQAAVASGLAELEGPQRVDGTPAAHLQARV